jgi:hypothetical protein
MEEMEQEYTTLSERVWISAAMRDPRLAYDVHPFDYDDEKDRKIPHALAVETHGAELTAESHQIKWDLQIPTWGMSDRKKNDKSICRVD